MSVLVGFILFGLIKNIDSNTNTVLFPNGEYNVTGQNFKTVGIENGNATFTKTDGKKVEFFMVEGEQKKNRYVTFQNKKGKNANLYKVSKQKNAYDLFLIKKGAISDTVSFSIEIPTKN